MPQTLYDKLWNAHLVHEDSDGTALIYIDRHLVHEVTSPQAFEGLEIHGRKPWRLKSILATADHNVPTTARNEGIADPISRLQVETLDKNIEKFGVKDYFGMHDARQGIVHVIGPEQGATLPGMTVVCGDSHTSTHGAFAALAFGIGTSEVEHVMATQCLVAKKSRSLLIRVEGKIGPGVTAKDIVLAIIGKIGTAGGTGHAIEFAGSAIRALSMEGRMTVCNMAIEAGARAGMVQLPMKTLSMRMSVIGVPGLSPMYCNARSIASRFPGSVSFAGSGTMPLMLTTISGEVPHVTCGVIDAASRSTTRSNVAPVSECNVLQ